MNPVTVALSVTHIGLVSTCVLYTLLSVDGKSCSTSLFAACSSPIRNKMVLCPHKSNRLGVGVGLSQYEKESQMRTGIQVVQGIKEKYRT